MKRSELRRDAEKARAWLRKPRKRINRMSARQQRFEAQLNAMRVFVHQRSGGFCEARLPGCTGFAQHVHHKGGRKRPDANRIVLLLDVCWHCHSEIHAHPEQSYALGLLVHSWQDAA